MSILISSANATTRKRWTQILQDEHKLLIVSDILELKSVIQQNTIELILLHRSMADMGFISELTAARIFVLSDIPNDNEAFTLLRHGVVGFANTYISAARLKEAVNTILTGRVWVGQKLMQKIIRGAYPAIDEKRIKTIPEHNLSDREEEVALLVSKGKSNLEIAAELNISERTVKAHISSIFRKTKTESRLQLALYIKTMS